MGTKILSIILFLIFSFNLSVFASPDKPIAEDIFLRDDFSIVNTSVSNTHEVTVFKANENLKNAKTLNSGDLLSTTITIYNPIDENIIVDNTSEKAKEDIEKKLFFTWKIKNWRKAWW